MPWTEPVTPQRYVEGSQGAAKQQTKSQPAMPVHTVHERGDISKAMPKSSQVSVLNQIDALQAEIAELRGQLELQQHDISKLKRQSGANMGNVIAPAPTPEANGGVAVADHERVDFDSAYAFVRKRDFAGAKRAFESFLKRYPKSQYAANAEYWLGEIAVQQGDARTAEKHMKAVLANYSDSDKSADAGLKLGFIAYDNGQWRPARKHLQWVVENFPHTSQAGLAQTRISALDRQGL